MAVEPGQPVLVTTSKRGVFIGILVSAGEGASPEEGLVVHLRDLRMVIRWPDRGVLSIQTRTDFANFRLSDKSPGARIPYVDLLGPMDPISYAAALQVPTWQG